MHNRKTPEDPSKKILKGYKNLKIAYQESTVRLTANLLTTKIEENNEIK